MSTADLTDTEEGLLARLHGLIEAPPSSLATLAQVDEYTRLARAVLDRHLQTVAELAATNPAEALAHIRRHAPITTHVTN